MVPAPTPERIKELIQKGVEGGADAFGIQIGQLEKRYRTAENLKDIVKAAQGRPMYVTNYRTHLNEGMTDEELEKAILFSAECGCSLIDVMGDLYCPSQDEIAPDEEAGRRQKELIRRIHSLGAEVLMSSHTHRYLPPDEVIKIAKIQEERGADIIKIVTMADSEEEQNSNFEITARLNREISKPVLFLCGGSYCKRHRLVAPLITNGIFLCVAEQDEFTTPMQPLLSDAKEMVHTAICS